ncbi:SpoIID/LytB domain-containing protein [Rhodohalobacter sp. 8-1]|uniref:SpoIID/LytB domain-containing protein n=1 Tax=Rhodohalobacter sp. 8-1 TaxID=3131972 RepID=UPI0030EF785E
MLQFLSTQYRPSGVFLPLITGLIFLLQFFIQNVPSGESLDLNRADSVRVSLYNLNRPDSLQLLNNSAGLILYKGSIKDTLNSNSVNGSLYIEGGRLTFQNQQTEVRVDSLTLISDSSSTRLITDNFGYRHYSGQLRFKPDGTNRGIFIVNTVDLETYIASVVGSEMDFDDPEALKSQAVVSRTYALWSIKKSPYNEFDLYDHESSQVYVGDIPGKPRYSEAAESTRSEVLTWSNQLILAVFSSTCGGSTVDNAAVWGGQSHPYLSSQQDADACSPSPHFNWSYTMLESDFRQLIKQYYGFEFVDKQIENDLSGRVQKVMLTGPADDTLTFTGNEFRLFINRQEDPMAIRSTKYRWTRSNGAIIFEGKGLGHGVGLCQWGSLGLAKAGWNYKDILTFYFSGTKIVSLDNIESNTIRLYN